MTRLTDHKNRPRVVITGMGALTPCGKDVSATWDNLVQGKSGIGPITQFDATDFPTKFAGEIDDFDPSIWLDRKEIRRNDRFILLAIAAAEMAMEDAGYKIDPEEAHRVGVIVGAGIGGLGTIEKNKLIVENRGPGKISPFFIPALIVNLAPGQISIRIGAKGPNWSPVSACATSAHALGESLELIRRGQCDAVLSGGSESVISPLGIGGFNAMKALSTRNDEPEKASRPWDEGRDGFVMGEGAGLLLLESLEHALARDAKIYAELRGYGATADAFHITAPDGQGAKRCMVMAIEDSGLTAEQIDYVNAHGTSTPVGDRQEVDAVKDVFGEQANKLMMTSTKSMHGHLLGATGSVEAIVTTKVLETGIIPPTINLDNPSEGCDLDFVPHKLRERQVEAAEPMQVWFCLNTKNECSQMKIAVASDHAGWDIKEKVCAMITSLGHEVEDYGPDSNDRVDYPDYAQKVSADVQTGTLDRGVLICGSGIGMSIAANRFKGVRAVVAVTGLQAKMSRQHNDANVLCVGARFSGISAIEEIVAEFLAAEFEGGRHQGRVEKIDKA